jgi:hypothetical protein
MTANAAPPPAPPTSASPNARARSTPATPRSSRWCSAGWPSRTRSASCAASPAAPGCRWLASSRCRRFAPHCGRDGAALGGCCARARPSLTKALLPPPGKDPASSPLAGSRWPLDGAGGTLQGAGPRCHVRAAVRLHGHQPPERTTPWPASRSTRPHRAVPPRRVVRAPDLRRGARPLAAMAHHPRVLLTDVRSRRRWARWNRLDRTLKALAVMASAVSIGCSWCVDSGTGFDPGGRATRPSCAPSRVAGQRRLHRPGAAGDGLRRGGDGDPATVTDAMVADLRRDWTTPSWWNSR